MHRPGDTPMGALIGLTTTLMLAGVLVNDPQVMIALVYGEALSTVVCRNALRT
jgi:hypothetical protein